MAFWPFTLDGSQFLMLYGLLLVATVTLGHLIPLWFRPAGRYGRINDPDKIALLGGGEVRLAETVLTRLVISEAITHIGDDRFGHGKPGVATSDIDRDIATMMPGSWRDIEDRIATHGQTLRREFVSLGLMMNDAEIRRMRLTRTLPCLALLIVGVIRIGQGIVNDKPIGYLIILLIITALLGRGLAAIIDQRTSAGQEVLKDATKAAERLSSAPMQSEMPYAVALFGTAVLVGSSLGPLHAMRHPPNSGGGSGNDSSTSCSSDSGGGDSGGGCGGCGGGGD